MFLALVFIILFMTLIKVRETAQITILITKLMNSLTKYESNLLHFSALKIAKITIERYKINIKKTSQLSIKMFTPL